ncbi:MAG: hypothetical protein ACP5VE_13410 [Chthonomonadales bacterium]
MPSTARVTTASQTRTLIGWQGIRFVLPSDWNLTGFSIEPHGGYLKVDSPGTMFAQIRWTDRAAPKPRTLFDYTLHALRRIRLLRAATPPEPELRAVLEAFLTDTRKQARKSKGAFEYRIKPWVQEAGGMRQAHHFSWSAGDQGQGKIWRCSYCGRTVIAQVVGRQRDDVAQTAAGLFSSMVDHPEDGWTTWALYDFVGAAPEDFRLVRHKLMSGYLLLELERPGERLRLERWGLANVALKKFTLAEWFRQVCAPPVAAQEDGLTRNGHPSVEARGTPANLLRRAALWFRSGASLRPALWYSGCAWACPQSNRIYAVQLWRPGRNPDLLDEVADRCECHGSRS